MTEESQRDLEDVTFLLKNHRPLLKPIFGLMFWELQGIENKLSAEEIASQGMNFTMADSEDEIIASFMAAYVKLWLSAKDFNAASRFVSDKLEMSADELLQLRQIYLERQASH